MIRIFLIFILLLGWRVVYSVYVMECVFEKSCYLIVIKFKCKSDNFVNVDL